MMIQTTQRSLPLVAENASVQEFHYRVDKGLSQMNKKLYRQGMNYHCRVQLNSDGISTNTEYKIYTLPKDHRTIGAMRMARSIYNAAVKDELQIRPEVKTAWTDFKIRLQNLEGTHTNGMMTNQARTAFKANDGLTLAHGESTSDSYQDSQITDSLGVQRYFAMATEGTGANSAWNIWTEYRNYLLNRADPDSAAEIPAYGDASAVLTEMAELADKGDEPPYAWNQTYSRDGAAGTAQKLILVQAGTLSAGISDRQQGRQFIDLEAPLGLIFIDANQDIDQTFPELTIVAKPGNYKGVKADKLYPVDKLLGF